MESLVLRPVSLHISSEIAPVQHKLALYLATLWIKRLFGRFLLGEEGLLYLQRPATLYLPRTKLQSASWLAAVLSFTRVEPLPNYHSNHNNQPTQETQVDVVVHYLIQ